MLPAARQSDQRLPSRENQPDLSIVIVSWNVRDDLLRCLSALRSASVAGALQLEIIVVDNASTDGTVQALNECPVVVVANKENVGYGRANNHGFAFARGKYIVVLNPDTIPQDGSLPMLVRFADTHPRVGIVAPQLLNPDGTVQPSAFAFPKLAMAAIDLFRLPSIVPGRIRTSLDASALNGRYPHEAQRTRPFKIDHPLGACFLVRREAYEECGGFDEKIFMYSEEIDLALRYSRAGWQCWQVPASRVVHLGGHSTRQMPDQMFVELWRSRLYLYKKHYSRPAQFILRLLLRIAMLSDLAGSRFGHAPDDPAHHALQARRASKILRLLDKK